ncbi:MAG: phosphoribosylamine--glycine ligase [DPANN group archaeon]|nr:phosphoribosylamine--glycine ligase [DPANN group archaeon]
MDETVKVLLIGNGAREHVLAKTFMRAPEKVALYGVMAAKNPGIGELCEESFITPLDDLASIVAFAKRSGVDFAVIGPEKPLADGIVDALAEEGIPSVGPTRELAQLESSKGFTRSLMERYGVPGLPRFMILKTEENLQKFIDGLEQIVVKPDGLTGGKGVQVQGDHFQTKEEGLAYAKKLIEQDGKVVIEEKLVGEEFSLMTLTDGRTIRDCPLVQDHKRAFVMDKGPNTGGMGSYSEADHSLPFLTAADVRKARRINEKMVEVLYRETGKYFKGVLYGGFIATKDDVKLIEYNVRFGDPEAMNVLPLLRTSLVSVCRAIIDGTLRDLEVEFDHRATVCKYIVPEGYPEHPVKGETVTIGPHDADLYFASVEKKDGHLVMLGSRALAFVGVGATLEEAERIAQASVEGVKGKVFFRQDIGTQKLIDRRIAHMQELRGE